MKLFIRNMISLDARTRALAILRNLGLRPIGEEIGEVVIPDNITSGKYDLMRQALRGEDFDLVYDKEEIFVEKIRYLVIEMIHYSEELPETNFSNYISDKLHLDYTYLSRCFSKIRGMTIREYIIAHKIKRVKQLLLYNDMTLAEIAWKLNYSSTSHLSSQFKKVTGLTPSVYKKAQQKTWAKAL